MNDSFQSFGKTAEELPKIELLARRSHPKSGQIASNWPHERLARTLLEIPTRRCTVWVREHHRCRKRRLVFEQGAS